MSSALGVAVGWLARNVVGFVLILIVLVAGRWGIELYSSYADYAGSRKTQQVLREARQKIETDAAVAVRDAEQRIGRAADWPLVKLDERLRAIEEEIRRKQAQKRAQAPSFRSLLTTPRIDDLVTYAGTGVALELLHQEQQLLISVRPYVANKTLEEIRLEHAKAYSALMANDERQTALEKEDAQRTKVLGRNRDDDSRPDPAQVLWPKMYDLRQEYRSLKQANQKAFDAYTSASTKREELAAHLRSSLGPFRAHADERVSEYLADIDLREQDLQQGVAEVTARVTREISAAVLVLVGLILTPFAIRALFFFVLAPLAARCRPIRLLPEASGAIELPGQLGTAVDAALEPSLSTVKASVAPNLGPNPDPGRRSSAILADRKLSSVSVRLAVGPADELLVQPGCLQSSAIAGSKRTQWFLNPAYPLSSLLSGMVALTRVRAERPEVVVLAVTDDALSELAPIALPKGSAMVLQPRCLVGVLKPRGQSVRITRHWRLASLHAWLTLQLRYLVFHGPVTLIVKGCRGVRVETTHFDRRVNQASTLGFSANLAYSTLRSETFVAYATAREGLLDDVFRGDRGFVLYEEMPRLRGRGGVTGRNLEALTDSVLKVVGI